MRYVDLGDKLRNYLTDEAGMPKEFVDEDQVANWIDQNCPRMANLMKFMRTIGSESERGCVICASAFIDNALEQSIRVTLRRLSSESHQQLDAALGRKSPAVSENMLNLLLTNRLAPLGSFAMRTKMARALGLIDDKTVKALDGMRTMRNDASHLAHPFSFNNNDYNMPSMFEPLSETERNFLGRIHRNIKTQQDVKSSMRSVFEYAAISIYFMLDQIAARPESAWITIPAHAQKGAWDDLFDSLSRQTDPMSGSSSDDDSEAQT